MPTIAECNSIYAYGDKVSQCAMYAVYIGCPCKPKKKIYRSSIIIAAYFSSYVVVTILTGGSIFHALNCVLPQMLFLIYSDKKLREDTRKYVECFVGVLKSYIVLNVIMLMIFPSGVGKYIPGYNYNEVDSRISFLGLDNGYLRWFLIAIILFYFVYYNKNAKRNIFYLLMYVSMLFVFSGTGIVCLSLMYLYMYLLDSNRLSKMINYKMYVITSAVLELGIVLFRVTDRFSDFFVNVLGKDITFTGRTLLWDQAMLLIAKHPIIGYGLYNYNLLISPANGQAYSSHNTTIQMMLNGGFIALFFFMIIVVYCGKCLKESKSTVGKSILCMAMLTMWINGITENMVLDQQIYMLFVIGFNYDSIVRTFVDKGIEIEKRLIKGDYI